MPEDSATNLGSVSGVERRSARDTFVVTDETYPALCTVIVDTTNARRTAEFYRELFGYRYRPGDEPPPGGRPDPKGQDWLVLRDPAGGTAIGFQQVDSLEPTTWPAGDVPMQLHLDFVVPDIAELRRHYRRAIALGAKLKLDRTDDEHEPLYVLSDPAGHPFCLLVG